MISADLHKFCKSNCGIKSIYILVNETQQTAKPMRSVLCHTTDYFRKAVLHSVSI